MRVSVVLVVILLCTTAYSLIREQKYLRDLDGVMQ